MQTPTRPATLLDLLVMRAETAPSTPALGGVGQDPLTYVELLEQVVAVGATLGRHGLGKRDRIAVVLSNGPELALAFLGVATHACCAPLNPDYTADELDFYLGDLEAKAVIVRAGAPSPVRDVARARGVRILELVGSARAPRFELMCDDPVGAPAAHEAVSEGDTALALHTSGTTGRPKLVPLSHANLMASAHNVARTAQLSAADCGLNVMPLFHIHGLVAGTLAALASGGRVVTTPGFRRGEFLGWLSSERPTWYTAVPTIHHAVLEEGAKLGEAGTTLRFIRSSSASLPPIVMAGLERTFGVPVIEAFGMTEAAHQVASNPLPPLARKPGSVGVAAGPEVKIIDSDGRACPAGQRGEVVIRGANVMTGYVGGPDVNATAFTESFFRTGDEGFLDPEGYLFLTGRFKEMINRAGEKVAPREVDELLLQHPAVAQAVTFAVPHVTMGEDVAAAVVLKPDSIATERDLQSFLEGKLAEFKRPRRIIIVDEIPRGPSGKLQRIGLADVLAAKLADDAATQPRDDLERALARIWCDVLRLPEVSVTANFFSLGGDSLSASVIAQRAAELGVSADTVFANPTIAEIAAAHRTRTGTVEQGNADAPLVEELPGAFARDERPALSRHEMQRTRRSSVALALVGAFVLFVITWIASGR